MTLSRTCLEWRDVIWYTPRDFTRLHTTRGKICCSCHKLIDIDSEVLRFYRFRYPTSDIDMETYGEDEEIPMATWYMCAACGEIFLNLESLGFCVDIRDRMQDLLKEYNEMTGLIKER